MSLRGRIGNENWRGSILVGLLTGSHNGDDNRVWLIGKLILVCSVQGHGQVYQKEKQYPAYMIVLLKINKRRKRLTLAAREQQRLRSQPAPIKGVRGRPRLRRLHGQHTHDSTSPARW